MARTFSEVNFHDWNSAIDHDVIRSDAGVTVLAEDPALNRLMKKAGKKMHLQVMIPISITSVSL